MAALLTTFSRRRKKAVEDSWCELSILCMSAAQSLWCDNRKANLIVFLCGATAAMVYVVSLLLYKINLLSSLMLKF